MFVYEKINGCEFFKISEVYKIETITSSLDIRKSLYGYWSLKNGLCHTDHFNCGQSSNIQHKWERRKNLTGVTLITSTDDYPPFMVVSHDNLITGMWADIFHDFQGIMNFKYVIKKAPDGRWGTLGKNGQWNGIIGMFQDEKVDCAPVGYASTPERSHVMDFGLPFTFVSGTP